MTTAALTIRLRYFASLREALGEGETLAMASPATVADVRAQLVARGGAYAEVLAPGRAVRAALNQRLCVDATPLPAQAELAFFPPVTGG